MRHTSHPAVRPPGGVLRVGLIGAGDISFYHLTAWRAAGCEVVAICDSLAPRAEARAREFGIGAVCTDAARMLETIELDAVDIATWRDSHPGLVRLAIAAGRHVLCQKPLASSLAESEALAREAAGSIRLMVNENRRFAPNFELIADWIAAGHVGSVRQVHMIMHRSGFLPDEAGRRPAVLRTPRMGTEPRLLIAETMIHQLDVLRHMLGPLKVVAARTARTEPDMPGETLATILLETAEHAPVVLSGSFVAPGFGTTVSDRLELIGNRSSVVMDGMVVESRGAFVARQEFDAAEVYQACFDRAASAFAQALLAGTPFPESVEGNLETLRLVEQAYEAAGLWPGSPAALRPSRTPAVAR